jgi:hypothetical protein
MADLYQPMAGNLLARRCRRCANHRPIGDATKLAMPGFNLRSHRVSLKFRHCGALPVNEGMASLKRAS